jgi:hypothetical protein
VNQSEANALWGRSGGRCAKCNIEISKTSAKGRAYPIGDQAHIVGKSAKSPRGASAISAKDRASPDNHILLCATCHREVDGDPGRWAVELLRTMKAQQEDRIRVAGERIPMSELSGTIDVEAVDVDEAIGADIQSPTRILPGTRVGLRAQNVRQATGVKISVRGDRDV